jgi:hypothetical protein
LEIQPQTEGLDWLRVMASEYDAKFEVFGDSPVQALGTVLGRELYFRARHDKWSFEVADHSGNLPSDGYLGLDGFYREGDYPNAGWMPLQDAVKIIVRCLKEFTGVIA